jgi:hypothetical protein
MGMQNAGFAAIAARVGGITKNAFTYLEIGTSSTAHSAEHAALLAPITDSGLARASATVSRLTTTVSNDTTQWLHEWTATASKTIQEIGVLNAASGGDMLCRSVIDPAASIESGETYAAIIRVAYA